MDLGRGSGRESGVGRTWSPPRTVVQVRVAHGVSARGKAGARRRMTGGPGRQRKRRGNEKGVGQSPTRLGHGVCVGRATGMRAKQGLGEGDDMWGPRVSVRVRRGADGLLLGCCGELGRDEERGEAGLFSKRPEPEKRRKDPFFPNFVW